MEISTSKRLKKKEKDIDLNKPKLTVKEFKRQWILVAIASSRRLDNRIPELHIRQGYYRIQVGRLRQIQIPVQR